MSILIQYLPLDVRMMEVPALLHCLKGLSLLPHRDAGPLSSLFLLLYPQKGSLTTYYSLPTTHYFVFSIFSGTVTPSR